MNYHEFIQDAERRAYHRTMTDVYDSCTDPEQWDRGLLALQMFEDSCDDAAVITAVISIGNPAIECAIMQTIVHLDMERFRIMTDREGQSPAYALWLQWAHSIVPNMDQALEAYIH